MLAHVRYVTDEVAGDPIEFLTDVLGRADERAGARKALLEVLAEGLEQMDMLGLLAGKLQQRAHPIIVAGEMGAGVFDDVREYEFLDQTEHGEVLVAADLVQSAFFLTREKRQSVDSRERLGHERLGKIQPLVPADHFFDSPADF